MDLIGALAGAAGAAGEAGNPNAWDISKAYYDGPYLGDLSKAVYSGYNKSVSSQDLSPRSVVFSPDGTKMIVLGSYNDSVYEYTLTTPWIVSTATYDRTLSVSGQDTFPLGLYVRSDGLKMYIAGNTGNDINEYSLSTAWNISTASYVRNFSVSAQDGTPNGVFFKDDGIKMYVVGEDGQDINEYTLSTAWNISTASYSQNFSVAAKETAPSGVSFNSDGSAMYVCGRGSDSVHQYSLSTAWDISTASFVRSLSVTANANDPHGLWFKPDGSLMFVVYPGGSAIIPYTIGGFSVAAKETNPFGVFFKPDGTIMYITGSDSDAIHSYTLSTAWDISTASFTDTFSVSATSLAPNDLFFKSDGTKMYLVDSNSDDVQEFSLSVAWDISTLSYVQNFSIAAREGISSGLFFKSDGTKMYVVGSGADTVLEYALSSAWDISSASYTQEFSVAAQETAPQSLSFKTDGTEMYMLGSSGDDVNQYSLSTAWDISTASYLQSFAVLPGLPRGLYFREDGMKFFTTDSFLDKVFSYSISEE